MKKKVPEILETLDDLQRRFKAEKDRQKRQRLHALLLLKTGQAKTRAGAACQI